MFPIIMVLLMGLTASAITTPDELRAAHPLLDGSGLEPGCEIELPGFWEQVCLPDLAAGRTSRRQPPHCCCC